MGGGSCFLVFLFSVFSSFVLFFSFAGVSRFKGGLVSLSQHILLLRGARYHVYAYVCHVLLRTRGYNETCLATMRAAKLFNSFPSKHFVTLTAT